MGLVSGRFFIAEEIHVHHIAIIEDQPSARLRLDAEVGHPFFGDVDALVLEAEREPTQIRAQESTLRQFLGMSG